MQVNRASGEPDPFQWTPSGAGALLVAVACMLTLGLLWFSYERAQVRLSFMVQSTSSGPLQLFFHEKGRFNESMSRWYPLRAGETQEIVLEKSGPHLAHLRIDPPTGGTVSLCGLALVFGGGKHDYVVRASHQVELSAAGDCLVLSSAGEASDPQVTMAGDEVLGAALSTLDRWWWVHMAVLCLFSVGLVLLSISLRWLVVGPIKRFGSIRWLGQLDRHAHWLCAGLMLLFGTIYLWQTPPGAVPDEAAHLAKIVKIRAGAPFGGAEGDMFPEVQRMYGPLSEHLNHKKPFSKEELVQQLSQPVVCTPTTPALARGADPYFPHHHALATAAFVVACTTESSFGTFLYSARFLNLLLATLLVGIGIAFAGRAKWALVFVALLPMSLFQMASLSADSLVIGLSIAWIGLTSGLAAGRIAVRRALPFLWILAIAIGLLKPGGAWILVSLLFCRDAFRESGRSFVGALLCFVALPWLLHLLLIVSVDSAAIVRAGVDPQANLQSLRTDPVVYLGLVWNTFASDYAQHLYRMMVGILGWIDVPLSDWAYAITACALVAAVFLGSSSEPDRPRWRVVAPVALVFALGSLVLISLPLYVRWTLPDATFVQGLQGRYFLPTLAFVMAWISIRSADVVRLCLLAFVLSTLVALNLDAWDRMHQAYFVVGRG